MPDMNGPDATRKILEYFNTDAKNIAKPLIFCLTAYTEMKFQQNAMEAGMDGFHTKLFNKEQLA